MSKPRPPTFSDARDIRRPYTPAKGTELAIPHEVPDEITANYSGEERQRMRERRETPERIRQLEKNGDDIRTDLGEFKTAVVERLTKVETHVEQIRDWFKEDREERREAARLRSNAETAQVGLEKVRLNGRAKIIVAIIGLLGAIIGVGGTLIATRHPERRTSEHAEHSESRP